MKKLGKVLLVVLAMVVVLVGLVFWGTRGLPEAADSFFGLIRDGKVHDAYLATAEEFQAATGVDGFQQFLQTTSLSEFQSASWSSRSISGDTGQLEGSVTTRTGAQIPLRLDLVKENGAWRILAVHKAEAGVVTAESAKEIPADAELQRLATDAVVALGDAINRDDFTVFYASVSRLWQSQVTAEELREAFRPFREAGIDLTAARGQTPAFDEEPVFDADGVLILHGYFTIQPAPAIFRVRFVYEHPEWRLIGININM